MKLGQAFSPAPFSINIDLTTSCRPYCARGASNHRARRGAPAAADQSASRRTLGAPPMAVFRARRCLAVCRVWLWEVSGAAITAAEVLASRCV